jgi:RecA/RadA recombinase
MTKILKKIKQPEQNKVTVKNLVETAPKFFIPTGNALLNLALSDSVDGGYGIGKMVNLIGDSSSGKTILALTMMAECNCDPHFDGYDFDFDDAEVALEIDIPKLFGKRFANRIHFRKSKTIEDFYGYMYNKIQSGKPFITILDSFDALTSRDEQKRAAEFGKQEAKRIENEEDEDQEEKETSDKQKGSYKTEKPKMASEIFRVCCDGIAQTDSFLIIISQTRDNIGFGAMFTPKTRSGGKALKFYATHEIWLATGKSHEKLGRPIGADCMVKVTKNKLTGKRREIYFPIYYDYGVDSIESCINFLIKEKIWTKTRALIDTKGFISDKMSTNKLISYIEYESIENKLNKLVQKVWDDIEEEIKLNRKPKYD